MFGTFALCLGPNASLEWNDVLAEYEERDEDTFVQAKEQYLLTKIHRDCAVDTKEWLQNVKKPRSMTVNEFMNRVKHFNNLIPYMPLPEVNAEEDNRVPSFTEAELKTILIKASKPFFQERVLHKNRNQMGRI